MSDLIVNKTKWNKALFEATQDLSKQINTMLISLICSHYEHNDAEFYDVCNEVIKFMMDKIFSATKEEMTRVS